MSSNDNTVTTFSATDPVKATVMSVGGASAGGTASSNKPTITGTGEPGQVVNLYDGGRWLGSTTVASDGTWSIAATTALKAGNHSFTAICVGADGVNGLSSQPVSVTVPSAPVGPAPMAPSIGGIIDAVGPVKGPLKPGDTTDDQRPTFTGTGTPGSTVSIMDGNKVIGSGVVDANGNYSIQPTTPIESGPHDLHAVAKNPDGATSTDSVHFPVTVNTTIPGAPVIGGITDPNTHSVIPPGGTTTSPNPVVGGTGTPGDIVTVSDNGKPIGSTTVAPDGSWSFTINPPLTGGEHNITATEVSPAGNPGPASPPITITLDTTPPAPPTIGTITDHVGPVTGPVTSGGTTDDTKPTFSGSGAKPGDIIKIIDNGNAIGSSAVAPDGTWSVTPSAALVDGAHTITAIETNPAGISSAVSPSVSIIVDTTTPAAPAIGGVIDPATMLPITPGSSITSPTPIIVGSGKPGDTIVVSDNGSPIGSTSVDANGNWTFTPNPPLDNGSHNVTAVEINGAGVSGPSSPSVAISIGAPPVITGILDSVGSITGNIVPGQATDDTRPVISGTGHAGDKITLMDGAATLGTVTVGSDGKWTFQPTTALLQGSHDLSAKATDTSGNTTPTSAHYPFIVDTNSGSRPAPAITGVLDNDGYVTGNVAKNGITDDSSPILSGTFVAGSVVTIMDGGAVLGSTIVKTDGTWTFTPTVALADGIHNFTASGVSAAGVASSVSAVYPITIDTTPSNGSAMIVGTSIGAGPEQHTWGSVISDYSVKFRVHGKPFTVYVVYEDGQMLRQTNGDPYTVITNVRGEAIVDGTLFHNVSNWSYLGIYTFSADGGRTFSDPYSSGVDTTFIKGVTDNTGSVLGLVPNGGTTDDHSPTISGYAMKGTVVAVFEGALIVGSAVADASGHWSLTPSHSFATGTHSLISRIFSPSGYSDVGLNTYTFTVGADPLTMGAPKITGLIDSVGPHQGNVAAGGTTDDPNAIIHGTALAGQTVAIFDGAVRLGQTIADASGQWSFRPNALSAGTHDLSAAVPVSDSDSRMVASTHFSVTVGPDAPVARMSIDVQTSASDAVAAPAAEHHAVTIDADPTAYFQQANAHVQGDHSGQDTIALTGDHQILDLTALSGKTAAAKISGVEVFDLGGHQNTLKVSLLDVLNLGEQDLFVHDGKQQVVVKGAAGDAVDLSNTHVAGVADGQWEQHGSAQVGGVTYAVFEHSGAHVELLVQQGVATTVHH